MTSVHFFTTLHKSFCHNKSLWYSLPLTAGHYISSLAHIPPLMPRGIDSVPLPRGYILNEWFDTRVRCHILYTEIFPWMIIRQPVGMFPYIRRTCCELSVSFSVISSYGFRLFFFLKWSTHSLENRTTPGLTFQLAVVAISTSVISGTTIHLVLFQWIIIFDLLHLKSLNFRDSIYIYFF